MKISGYGEFQQMRKSAQKDDAHLRENAEKTEQAEKAGNSSAVNVTISAEARRKGRLRMTSDYREAKVADVKARLESGTLVTDESVRSGTRKLVDGIVSGEI